MKEMMAVSAFGKSQTRRSPSGGAWGSCVGGDNPPVPATAAGRMDFAELRVTEGWQLSQALTAPALAGTSPRSTDRAVVDRGLVPGYFVVRDLLFRSRVRPARDVQTPARAAFSSIV